MPTMKTGQKVTGIIAVAKSGTGFVPHEDFDEDIIVYNEDLKTALNGDEVQVVVKKIKGERAFGKVEAVLTRAKEAFIGTVKNEKGVVFVQADDQRMYARIRIQKLGDAQTGDKVQIKIVRWKNMMMDPLGDILKVLGKAGEHETEMQSVMAVHGFGEDFPADVLKDAKKISENRNITEDEIAPL